MKNHHNSNGLHVCFVAPYAYSYLRPGASKTTGGAERQQYLIASELQRRGYSTSFIVFQQGNDHYERIDGINVWKTLPVVHYGGFKAYLRAPQFYLHLVRTLRRVNADLYYIRGNPPLHGLLAPTLRMLNQRYIYVVANDADIEPSKLDSYGRLINRAHIAGLKRASTVVAQTEHQQSILSEEYDINASIVPNGYTLPDKSEIKPMDDRDYILWIGSIDHGQKKPRRYLRLAKSLPEIEFKMIGSPIDQREFEYFQDDTKNIDNLDFLGFVRPNEVDEYYNNAVAVVNTSDYEGFPNVFLEAWRYCTPVISLYYDLDGLLGSGTAGIHSGSMERLREDVHHLYQNRAQAELLGHEGRSLVKRSYSLLSVVNKYETILENCS